MGVLGRRCSCLGSHVGHARKRLLPRVRDVVNTMLLRAPSPRAYATRAGAGRPPTRRGQASPAAASSASRRVAVARISILRIFPVTVIGNSSTTWT